MRKKSHPKARRWRTTGWQNYKLFHEVLKGKAANGGNVVRPGDLRLSAAAVADTSLPDVATGQDDEDGDEEDDGLLDLTRPPTPRR